MMHVFLCFMPWLFPRTIQGFQGSMLKPVCVSVCCSVYHLNNSLKLLWCSVTAGCKRCTGKRSCGLTWVNHLNSLALCVSPLRRCLCFISYCLNQLQPAICLKEWEISSLLSGRLAGVSKVRRGKARKLLCKQTINGMWPVYSVYGCRGSSIVCRKLLNYSSMQVIKVANIIKNYKVQQPNEV